MSAHQLLKAGLPGRPHNNYGNNCYEKLETAEHL